MRKLISSVCLVLPAAAGEEALSVAQGLVQQHQEGGALAAGGVCGGEGLQSM